MATPVPYSPHGARNELDSLRQRDRGLTARISDLETRREDIERLITKLREERQTSERHEHIARQSLGLVKQLLTRTVADREMVRALILSLKRSGVIR